MNLNRPANFFSISGRIIPKIIWFFILYFTLFVSCSDKNHNSHPRQGIIVYNVDYINHSGKNIPLQLLPKTMEMKFNPRYISYTIQDRLGLFTIQNITDIDEKNHTTLVKVFDKKFAYKSNKNEASVLFDTIAGYHITMLDDTSRLAGLFCHMAKATDPANDECFDVYYTPDIAIDHPNANTPYHKISGMLLGFRIPLKNIDLQLTAKKVNCKDIDDETFKVPETYKYISRPEMKKILISLLP